MTVKKADQHWSCRMNRIWLIVALAGLVGSTVHGYPAAYGPFERGEFPSQVAVSECVMLSSGEQMPPPQKSLSFAISTNSGTPVVHLQRVGNDMDLSWIITVTGKDGKRLGKSAINDMPSDYVSTYSADLNQDGIPDFMVNIWSGGCGLAAEGSTTTFLLSEGVQYICTNFYSYDFEPRDIVQFKPKGPIYYIQTDVLGSKAEETKDGRDHNFWVHQIYRFSGSQMVEANKDDARFPKWVWYSNKDNHMETDLLSTFQKERLLRKSNIPRRD
jgi:hypothetical protein